MPGPDPKELPQTTLALLTRFNVFNQLESEFGSREALAVALRHTSNEEAEELAELLEDPKNRDFSFGQLLDQFHRNPKRVMEALSEGQMAKGQLFAFLKLSSALPTLMAATLESALEPGGDGFKDRQMLMKISGLLKETSGVQVSVNQDFSNSGGLEKAMGGGSERILQQNPLDIEPED